MSDTRKRLEDMKNVIYSTNILFTDITNQFNRLIIMRAENNEAIEKLKSYKERGFTIDPTSMDLLLKIETEIYQKQCNILVKLKAIRDITNVLKIDTQSLIEARTDHIKNKNFEIKKNVVFIKLD